MHVALIIDGNRRYAKKNSWKPWKGHESGAENVSKLFEWCPELGINELTLYVLSVENLKRDKQELEELFKIAEKWFIQLKQDSRVKKEQFRIRFIGKLDLLPENLQKVAKELEEATKSHKNYTVNFCFAYSGRLELLEAIKKLKNPKNVTEEDMRQALWLSSEPDLIIRTGGQLRTSNFLPWQSIYSEWFFLDKLWPEFTKQDLEECISEFHKRQRNFGK